LILPANTFSVGKNVRITANGYYSNVSAPQIAVAMKLGATTVMTAGPTTLSSAVTSDPLVITFLLTGRTTGATGTISAQGICSDLVLGGTLVNLLNTATTTIDT